MKICSTHIRYNPQLQHCRKYNEDTTHREERQNVEHTGELPHIRINEAEVTHERSDD
jgi:hypothetical protein